MKLNTKEQKIFFLSDSHAYHKNIVRGISAWGHVGTRDFDTQEEHVAALVKNINDKVGEDDILFHLGDFSFGGIENIWNFRKQIKCKNIHLILGNHDHHIHSNKVLPNCLESLLGVIDADAYAITSNFEEMVCAKKLFTSVSDYKEISIDGQMICLMHYPARVWNNASKGSWFLYGHCHGNLPDYQTEGKKFKTMDVGLDTNELKPYSFEEIKEIMNTRHNLIGLDHHDANTMNHSKI